MNDLSGRTTIVIGASRGLGRAIATTYAQTGTPVVAVARTAAALTELANDVGTIPPEAADAATQRSRAASLTTMTPDPDSGRRRQPAHAPAAAPDMGNVLGQLGHRRPGRVPLAPRGPAQAAAARQHGDRDQQRRRAGRITAQRGYAGAKATQRFIAGYAQDEAKLAGLDITFTAELPRITPHTDLGRPAVQAYAARSGQSEREYLQQMGQPLTPEVAGAALVELVRADAATLASQLPAVPPALVADRFGQLDALPHSAIPCRTSSATRRLPRAGGPLTGLRPSPTRRVVVGVAGGSGRTGLRP